MPNVPQAKRVAGAVGFSGGRVSTAVPSVDTSAAEEIGGIAADIFKKEVQKANQVAVLDADLALSEAENKLFYDPETGALRSRGKNALIIQEPTMEALDKATEEIATSLGNDAQRFSFRGLAQSRKRSADKQLQNHVSTESFKYDTATTTALIASEQAQTAENYTDSEGINTSIEKQNAILTDYATRHGQGKDVLDEKLRENTSNNHKAIINRMLSDGNDLLATEYHKNNGDAIFNDDELRRKLGTASTDGEGARIASDVWDKQGPQSDIDPVELDKMASEVRKQGKGDKKVVDAAIADLSQRSNFHNNAATERTTANKSSVWGAYDDGDSIKTITTMEEYRNLSEADQVKIKSDITKAEKAKTLVDKDELRIDQEINRATLTEDLPLLRETDIEQMLRERELSVLGYKSLKRLLDPSKSPAAKAAFTTLDNSKTKRLFNPRDKQKNLAEWADATALLHTYIENNPEGDPQEFVSRIMEDSNRRAVGWVLDKFRFGAPALEEAEAERMEALRLEAETRVPRRGTKKPVVEVPEEVIEKETPKKTGVKAAAKGRVVGTAPETATNPATGERLVFKNGKWQKQTK